MVEVTPISNTNPQLLHHFDCNEGPSSRSQEWDKHIADKKSIMEVILSQCDGTTRAEMTLGKSPEYDLMTGGLLKFIKQLRKVCTHSKNKNEFFGSSISKFTKQHIRPVPKSKNTFFGSSISMFTEQHLRPTTRVKKILDTHSDDDCMWKNTDPCDVSLDDTSNSEEPVNSTMTTSSIGIEKKSKTTQDSVATTATTMSGEHNEAWYDTYEEYNSWHDDVETMDNYQELIIPPTVVGEKNMTDPIIEHIDPHIHQADEHPNSLTSTIPVPNSGWEFLLSILYKIIYFMLLCTFKAKVITCNTIEYVLKTLSEVIISTPIAIHKWFNKPRIPHTKKHRKTSNGSGKFSHKLYASKKSCYNERKL